MRALKLVVVAALAAGAALHAEVKTFTPVTDKMLVTPSPDDWLMFSRTYDAQRFSPLSQITRQNVAQLKEVFKVEFPNGQQEYGILELRSWDRGTPYAEPTLLEFAAEQMGRPVQLSTS